MRNAVAVVALLISVGGIFVSIAREEMRCYLGLANECGLPEKATSPNSTQKAARENKKEEFVSSPRKVESVSESKPEFISKPEAVSETREPSEKPVEEETAQKSLIEPFKSQPIEVIPPPDVQSESQPIEVTPPPENQP